MSQTHPIAYYINSGSPWSQEEDLELHEGFTKGLNIIELGALHKRTPGGISAKLKTLGLIPNTQKVAGYSEYKTSELYREILLETTTKKAAAAERKAAKALFVGVQKKREEHIEAAEPLEPPVVEEKPVVHVASLKYSLNCEQLDALNRICKGESIFLTGPGGSGKSYLLESVKQEFNQLGKILAITALTGCAALLLGPKAKTLHSWAGIGLGKGDIGPIISSIVTNGRKKNAWIKTDCLVIDEVSMMTPQLLEMLDAVGKRVRKCRDKPFGGLQIVFVGDFYQLPPISNDKNPFAFQSPVWNEIVSATICLKKIYRQSNEVFQKVLGEARIGELSEESIETLKGRMHLPWKRETIRPTLLFTRNEDVGTINLSHFAKLEGECKTYKVRTILPSEPAPGTLDGFFKTRTKLAHGLTAEELQWKVDRLDKDAPYEKEVCLKVGAQVMLITNLNQDAGLINGSRGVVKDFDRDGLPLVLFASTQSIVSVKLHRWKGDDDCPMEREQIPLRLAYALTIHKAQGSSLDSALIDIGPSTFEYGQAYVALSRIRNLETLFVHDFDPKAFRVHPAVKAFYDGLVTTRQK